MTTLADFQHLLSSHDWTYTYSDDHSIYLRGEQQSKAILQAYRALIDAGLKPEADKLYQQYRKH